MELHPRRNEARIIVACLMTFWLVGGGLGIVAAMQAPRAAESASALLLVPFAVVFAAGVLLYWMIFKVGGRELGRRPIEFLVPTRRPNEGFFAAGIDGWRVILKLLDPRWYALLVRSTVWNRRVVGALLVVSFFWAIGASIVMTASRSTG